MYQTAQKTVAVIPQQEVADRNMALKLDQEERQKCYGKNHNC